MKINARARLWGSVAILAGALAAVLLGERPIQGQATGPTVTVVNTASNPVPINGTATVSGTVGITGVPSVNVSNTPTVNAAQGGDWTVGINGVPNVAIAGTPTVNVASMPAVSLTGPLNATIAGGSVNVARPPITLIEHVNEPGLPAGNTQTYDVNPPMVVSSLFLTTANDIEVWVHVQAGEALVHPLGKFSSGSAFYSFDQPIVIDQVQVKNPAILTSATFGIDLAGDAAQ